MARSFFGMRSRRPFTSPLPTATAIVVAVLVAMATSLGETSAAGPTSERGAPTRVPSSLVLPSRALATALASVAERLEEDWNGHRRVQHARHKTLPSLRALALPWGWTHLAASKTTIAARRGECAPAGGAWKRDHAADEISAADPLRTNLERQRNLPPPALA